jgi:hypothetical protein
MPSYQHLDALIGEALECADDAAGVVRDLQFAPVDRHLKKIGEAIVALWEVRDALYKACPELKRDFVAEYELDESRYNALLAIQNEADEAEKRGRVAEAARLYQNLLAEAKFGYFKLCAEAGIYRNSRNGKA